MISKHELVFFPVRLARFLCAFFVIDNLADIFVLLYFVVEFWLITTLKWFLHKNYGPQNQVISVL